MIYTVRPHGRQCFRPYGHLLRARHGRDRQRIGHDHRGIGRENQQVHDIIP